MGRQDDFDPGDPTSGMKDISASEIQPGHIIISGQQFATVLGTKLHAPGKHPKGSPIDKKMTAREIITSHGSRWSGVENPAGEVSYKGYHPMWESHKALPSLSVEITVTVLVRNELLPS